MERKALGIQKPNEKTVGQELGGQRGMARWRGAGHWDLFFGGVGGGGGLVSRPAGTSRTLGRTKIKGCGKGSGLPLPVVEGDGTEADPLSPGGGNQLALPQMPDPWTWSQSLPMRGNAGGEQHPGLHDR